MCLNLAQTWVGQLASLKRWSLYEWTPTHSPLIHLVLVAHLQQEIGLGGLHSREGIVEEDMGEEGEEEDMEEEEEVEEDTVGLEEGWGGKTLHRMASGLVGLSVLVELFGGLLMSNVYLLLSREPTQR